MNELKIFENEQFGKVRTWEENGKILFCGSDCAKALGYSRANDAISQHCRYTTKHRIATKQGNMAEMSFIPEGDLYRLITHSKLPEAERFESWVFDEVLPSIRKNGGYIMDQENLSDDELLAKALVVAQKTLAEREKRITEQENKIQEMRPKEIFADAVSVSNSSILVRELAKLLKQNGVDIGQNRLYEYLRKHGYLIKQRGADYNSPTQKSMELGLFEVNERVGQNSDGSAWLYRITKVTGKGQLYFINKFLEREKAALKMPEGVEKHEYLPVE